MVESALDRIVHISDVAWFRNPDNTFSVVWTQDGAIRAESFRTERGAIKFARKLDLSLQGLTVGEIVEAKAAIRELEYALYGPETEEARGIREREVRRLREAEAEESLRELEPYLGRRGGVLVKGHRREIRRSP